MCITMYAVDADNYNQAILSCIVRFKNRPPVVDWLYNVSPQNVAL